jgi:predicted ester cyclase
MARRVFSITFDEDIYSAFKKNLKAKGYPVTAAGLILQQVMERINDELEYTDKSAQLEFFEIMKDYKFVDLPDRRKKHEGK